MKKVISFSLWGNSPKYTKGAIENAVLASKIFPDWICRFYIGLSTIQQAPTIVETLRSFNNVEIVVMSEEGDWTGMFWRFAPCSDPDVEYMLSRDCDSRLSIREKAAVDDWIRSGKNFHIIRDHPLHLYKILGGLWGAKRPLLKNIDELMADYSKKNYWNIDQEFLGDIVFPMVRNEALVHDEFLGLRSIPMPRPGDEFLGEIFDDNNEPDSTQRALLRNEIMRINRFPLRFRRVLAKNWRRLKGNLS